uniref:Uncharacterized protein n=1 Tax=Glossina brevipalpis TaxID=37001 RepID=A0A1A9WPQ7_9MUSC
MISGIKVSRAECSGTESVKRSPYSSNMGNISFSKFLKSKFVLLLEKVNIASTVDNSLLLIPISLEFNIIHLAKNIYRLRYHHEVFFDPVNESIKLPAVPFQKARGPSSVMIFLVASHTPVN